MSRRNVILAGATLALVALALGTWERAAAGEAQPTSGPAIGSSTPQFDHHGITGPWKGDPKVCYV